MNKSLKTLHEEKSNPSPNPTNLKATSTKKGVTPTAGTRIIDLNDKPKISKTPQTMPRSSSATQFDKEGTDVGHDPAPLTPLSSNIPPQRNILQGSSLSQTVINLDRNRYTSVNLNNATGNNVTNSTNTRLSNTGKYIPKSAKLR